MYKVLGDLLVAIIVIVMLVAEYEQKLIFISHVIVWIIVFIAIGYLYRLTTEEPGQA